MVGGDKRGWRVGSDEGTTLCQGKNEPIQEPWPDRRASYIKENGEKVQGHTKNAPHDGKALPRHPDQYVTLPFEFLDGDLMIGLFGELHYE